jgi:hypothetical protein
LPDRLGKPGPDQRQGKATQHLVCPDGNGGKRKQRAEQGADAERRQKTDQRRWVGADGGNRRDGPHGNQSFGTQIDDTHPFGQHLAHGCQRQHAAGEKGGRQKSGQEIHRTGSFQLLSRTTR